MYNGIVRKQPNENKKLINKKEIHAHSTGKKKDVNLCESLN